MDRICTIPNCGRNINLLPDRSMLCTDHQIQFNVFQQDVKNWTEGRNLPPSLCEWAFFRLEKGCKTKDLASVLNITVKDLWIALPRQKIHFDPTKGPKVVPIEEIVRILDFFSNMDEVKKAIKKNGYLVAGKKNRVITEKGKFSTVMIAEIFHVNISSVHKWIERGLLQSTEKNRRSPVFSQKDMTRFLRIACSGKETFKANTFSVIKKMVMSNTPLFTSLKNNVEKAIPTIIGTDTLPEKDVIFAVFHRKGCSRNQLQEHIEDVYTGSISEAIDRGILSGIKKDRRCFLPFTEMIKALSSLRNWVPLRKVKIESVSFSSFCSYVEEGHFGETALNLSGHLSIRRSVMPEADRICRKIRAQRRRKKIDALIKNWYESAQAKA